MSFAFYPLAVLDPIEPGYSVRVPTPAELAARTLEAIADSLAYTDEQAGIVVEDSDRIDPDVMEHPIILYSGDWIATDDGGRWTMPNGSPPLILTRDRLWTHREISAEHTRQSRLQRWQRLP